MLGALDDHLALELSEDAQHLHHHPTGRTWPQCLDQLNNPGCVEDSTGYHRAARVGVMFGCSDYGIDSVIGSVIVDLCTGIAAASPEAPTNQYQPWFEEDGFFSAWLNPAVYWDKANSRAPLWQQSHIDIDPYGDSCPNGKNGRVTSALYRAAANSFAYDGSPVTKTVGTRAHPNGGGARIDLYLGHRTGAVDEESSASTVLDPDPNYAYQLSTTSAGPSNSGLEVRPLDTGYGSLSGIRRDPFGEPQDLSHLGEAFSNYWETPGAENQPLGWDNPDAIPQSGRIQLVSGVDFDGPAAGHKRAATLSFQFVADYSQCT